METAAEVRRKVPFRHIGLALAWAAILGTWAVKAQTGVLLSDDRYRRQDERAAVLRMPSEAYSRIEAVVSRWSSPAWAVEDMKAYDGGSVSRRVRFAIYVGALQGAKPAAERLRLLDGRVATGELVAPPAYVATRRILGAIYEDPEASTPGGLDRVVARLPAADAETLRRSLGWFGRLALEPGVTYTAAALARVGDPRPSSPESLWLLATAHSVFFHTGLVVLILVLPLLLYLKVFGSGLGPPVPWYTVLAECAALLGLVEIAVPSRMLSTGMTGFMAEDESWKLLALGIALSWPLARRIPFRDFLGAAGWTRGGGIAKEVAIGLLAFPLLVSANSATRAVLPAGARHSSTFGAILASGETGVFLVTAVGMILVAPLVEESCYRGFLYRHVREALRVRTGAGSVAAAIAVSGFLFAAIHPGGPATFADHFLFAAATALLFEWRGSLLPSMALHSAWNLWSLVAISQHGT